MGEIIYVDFPHSHKEVATNDTLAVVESVKTIFDITSPISGQITHINETLKETPTILSESPYENGWLIKVKVEKTPNLLSYNEYQKTSKSPKMD